MSIPTTAAPNLELEAYIESILFVSSGPVSLGRLARTLEITTGAARQALHALEARYAGRGLRLQWLDEAVQFTTAPEAGLVVERFLGLEAPTSRLSHAALEVLAIVAYMQPITRPQVDELRGVNSDGAMRTLLSKGLVEEIGRVEAPGRPILYGTTPEFMQHFGLSNMAQLPPLEGVEARP
ncbi:MAG: SMC-Scp complex subunit ScpB [Chloroflexi bacterium]|nr:SMC-Scp complex subunit ScpB [Chloroflexota bacterium]